MQAMNLTLTVALALSAVVMPSTTVAEEYLTFDTILAGGALICDKPDSVVTFLESNGTERLPDCGRLMTQKGTPATVTIIEPYVWHDRTFYVAMYQFDNNVPWGVPIQYGFWAGGLPEIKGTAL